MWIDPRIQGRLRELIQEFGVASEQERYPSLMDLATAALQCAQEEAEPYCVAEASLCVAKAYQALKDYNEAIKIGVDVAKYCEKEGEHKLLARTKVSIANSYFFLEKFTESEQMYLDALHLAEQYEMEVALLSVYHGLAAVYGRQGRLQEAIDITYKFKGRVEKLDVGVYGKDYQMSNSILVHDLLGALYGDLGDYQTTLSHYKQVLAIAQAAKLPNHQSNAYYNIGCLYGREEKNDLALKYFQEALKIESSDYYKIYQLYGLSCAYMAIGELDNAETTINKALTLASGSGNTMIASLTGNKGKILLARNDPNGISWLLDALEMKRKEGDVAEVDEFLKDIINYYKGIGDYEHAFQYHQELMDLIKNNSDEKQRALSRVEVERREQDKKIFQMELEKKESKLKGQERELALTASQLASQADLLGNFRNDLRKIVREMGDPIDALKHIKQRLKDLPCEQIDWAKFEAEFVTVHPEFRQKLLERFPDLTSQEMKMCIFARIGLKNAEIARLTCLSERSVESHRYTLRKKLGIAKEENLTQFLSGIK